MSASAIIAINFLCNLAASILGPLAVQGINRLKSTPETKAVKAAHPWKTRVWNFFLSPWYFLPFCIATDVFFLHRELTSTAPLTRQSVYNISIDVAGILFSIVNMNLLLVWRKIRSQALEVSVSALVLDLVNTTMKFAQTAIEQIAGSSSPDKMQKSEKAKSAIVTALEKLAAVTKDIAKRNS